MRRKLLYSLIGILVISFGGLLATLIAGNTPSLGLDLQGGISITQQPVGAFNTSSLDLAVDRIRERVDSLGVAEPEILRQGDAIVVNLPGVKNQQQAEDLVKVTGQVYLRPVLTDDQFGGIPCVTSDPNAKPTPTTTTTTVAGGTTTTAAGATTVGATTTAGATTTTAAGGPSRRPSSANTTTTAAGTTTAAPTTTVAGGSTTTTTPGATTTTVAGTANTLPDVAPDSTG